MTRTLDPAQLDGIVADLELADLATLERTMLALRLAFNDIESWLRRLAGDEDSWLNRLADLFGAANDSASGLSPLDVLFVAVPALLAATALCAAAIFLWRRYQTGQQTVPEPAGMPGAAAPPAVVPVADLAPEDQPAALFRHVCTELASDGLIRIEKNQTNSAIARAAQLPEGARNSLKRLARGADRALFGGWRPSEPDLIELRRHSGQLLGERRSPS